jgi:hypothetical protein
MAVHYIKLPGLGGRRAVVLPTIHRNGTSAKRLYEQASDVLTLLRQARKAIEDSEPHGRDLHMLPEDERLCAASGHERRLRDLDDIIADYEILQRHASEHTR